MDQPALNQWTNRLATNLVQELAGVVPGRWGLCGGRRNPHQGEAIAASLIAMNERYKARACVRIADVDV